MAIDVDAQLTFIRPSRTPATVESPIPLSCQGAPATGWTLRGSEPPVVALLTLPLALVGLFSAGALRSRPAKL